uniref:Uncharacterized protein n=1 Tax=viral metagenome TaxID=1070528 RepID=A0A6C0HJS0_9ZZZZ
MEPEEPDFVIEAPKAAASNASNMSLGEFNSIPIKSSKNKEPELPEPAPNAPINAVVRTVDDSMMDVSDELLPAQGLSIRMEIGSQDPKRPGMAPFHSVYGLMRFQNNPKKMHHGEFRDNHMLQRFLEKLTTPMAKAVWVTDNEKGLRIKNEDIIFVSNDNQKMGGVQIRLSNKGEFTRAYASKHYVHIDLYQFRNKALFDSVQQSIRAFFEAKHSIKKFTRKRITRKHYRPSLAKTRSKGIPFHRSSRRKIRKFDKPTRRLVNQA